MRKELERNLRSPQKKKKTIKKAIVRELIKAINPTSGRAAGGDFLSTM